MTHICPSASPSPQERRSRIPSSVSSPRCALDWPCVVAMKLRNHAPLSWLRRRVCASLHLSRPSGLVVYAHCHRELVTKSWTARMTTDRWTRSSLERQEAIEEAPRRARGDRQGCTECRRFPLRVYTGVYHDRCRPEVAVAQHLHSLSSCLWVACSSSGSRVARRLPGRHTSVAARPLRCRPGLSVGRRPPWCPQVVFLPAGTGVDTSLE